MNDEDLRRRGRCRSVGRLQGPAASQTISPAKSVTTRRRRLASMSKPSRWPKRGLSPTLTPRRPRRSPLGVRHLLAKQALLDHAARRGRRRASC